MEATVLTECLHFQVCIAQGVHSAFDAAGRDMAYVDLMRKVACVTLPTHCRMLALMIENSGIMPAAGPSCRSSRGYKT